MKITIFVKTEEEKQKVEEHVKSWVNENFRDQNFRVEIEGENK